MERRSLNRGAITFRSNGYFNFRFGGRLLEFWLETVKFLRITSDIVRSDIITSSLIQKVEVAVEIAAQ